MSADVSVANNGIYRTGGFILIERGSLTIHGVRPRDNRKHPLSRTGSMHTVKGTHAAMNHQKYAPVKTFPAPMFSRALPAAPVQTRSGIDHRTGLSSENLPVPGSGMLHQSHQPFHERGF